MDAIADAKWEGDNQYRHKRYSEAISAYSDALNLCEQHHQSELLHVLYSNRSAARLAVKEYQGALADAQASVAVNDRWLKGWFRSAKALQGLGRIELARQAAEKAQQLEPGNKEVQSLRQELKQQLQQQDEHDTGSQLGRNQEAPQQQQQQQGPSISRLPWQQVNQLRSQLDLKLLPAQLVVGSRYIPSPDGINYNLLLLLHGLGDTPAAFTALAQRMALPQTACLALSGPLEVPETDGGHAWFTAFDDFGELIQLKAGEVRRISSLSATVKQLQQLLFEVLPRSGGWRPADVHLLGFSQGGCVALELARTCCHDRQLGGVVAISAGLLEETLAQQGSTAGCAARGSSGSSPVGGSSSSGDHGSGQCGTPVLMTYGDRDNVVSRQRVDSTVAALRAAGCEVQLEVLPGKGHGMISSQEEMRSCMQFWAQHLRRRPADPNFVEVA